MIVLDFTNVEELVFYNTDLHQLLPLSASIIFEQWKVAASIPLMHSTAKRCVLDFLNQIDPEQLEILETYFADKIIVEQLNYNIVQNKTAPLDSCCDILCTSDFPYLTISRDADNLQITYWR